MTNDERILHQVLGELTQEPGVDSSRINATVVQSIVRLMGVVGSYAQKACVERAVRRIVGVRRVIDDLAVAAPAGMVIGTSPLSAQRGS